MWISFSTEAAADVEAMEVMLPRRNERWGEARARACGPSQFQSGVDLMKETRVGQGENLKEGRLITGEALGGHKEMAWERVISHWLCLGVRRQRGECSRGWLSR